MERTLNLRLHSNGQWSAIDDNGGDKLAFELENNATSIVIQLPDATSGYTHYLEIELPDGTVLLSSAITEELRDSIRCLVIPVGYPITAQFGRVRIQYVGRKESGNKEIRSSLLALDVDESIDGFVAGQSNPDFITWTEQHINDLTTRVVALENGESAEVHADSEFGTDGVIVVADGATGKKIKSGAKTIPQVLAEASTDAATKDSAVKVEVKGYTDEQVLAEKQRAQGVESGHETRIGTLETTVGNASSGLVKRVTDLENGEAAEVHADNNFSSDEIILVADGTGKKIKSGTKTIAQILTLISDEATARGNADSAEVTNRNTAISDAVNGEKNLREAADSALSARIDEIAGSSVIYGIRFTGNATSGSRLVSAEGLQFDLSQGINDFAARPLFSDIYEVELDSKDSSGNTISGAKQKFIHFPNFYFKRTKTLDSSSNIVESWYISPIAVSGYSPVLKNADGTVPSGFLVGKYETAFKDDTEALVGSFTGKKPVVNVNRDWVQARTAYVQDETKGISNLSPIDQSLPKQAWDAIAILITILTGSRDHQSTFKGVTEDSLFNPVDFSNVGNQATSAANYVVIPSNNYIVTNSSVGSKITIYSINTQSRRWEEHLITAIEADTPSAGLTKITFDGTATIMNAGTVRIGLHAGEKTGTTDSIVGDFGNLSTDNKHAFKVFGLENYYGNFWTILGGAAVKEIWNTETSSAENHLILPEGIDYTVGSSYTNYIDTEKNLSIADGYVKEVDFEGAVLIPTVTSGASSSSYFSDYYYQDHKSGAGDPIYRCFRAGDACSGGSSAGSFCISSFIGWSHRRWDFGFRSFILIP